MTLRKFASRSESVRKRHAPRLLYDQERRCRDGLPVNASYLRSLVRLLRQEPWVTDSCRRALDDVAGALDEGARWRAEGARWRAEGARWRAEGARWRDGNGTESTGQPVPPIGGPHEAALNDLARALNTARHALRASAGRDYADWDVPDDAAPEVQGQEKSESRFSIGIFGESIRSPFNVGSIVRSAEAFGAASCRFTPDSASVEHQRAKRSAMGSDAWIDIATCRLDQLEAFGAPVFAVETGGTPVAEFRFPARGIALLGNEELGLSRHALELAGRSAGIVTIPLYGTKASLNVASAAAIVLSWWTSSLAASR